jgi:hypothetical protein
MFPFTASYLTQKESSDVTLDISDIKLNFSLPDISDKHHTWEVKLTN